MRTIQAARHFGNRKKLAHALKISPQAVYAWGEKVPLGRAYQLESLTQGSLKVNPRNYPPKELEGAKQAI
jgi:transcriptional repressor of cell division inhibition gene dicB